MVYSETRGSRPWLHPVAPFGGWRIAGSQVLTGRNKPCAVSAWDFAHFRQQRYGECGLQAADLRINDRVTPQATVNDGLRPNERVQNSSAVGSTSEAELREEWVPKLELGNKPKGKN
jgi:hypothetical protein